MRTKSVTHAKNPVRAELVEACPDLVKGPFDKLRANGIGEWFLREQRAPTGAWDALKEMWLCHFP